MKTNNETLVKALHILVEDIDSVDGVANACIAVAAARIAEQMDEIARLRKVVSDIANNLGNGSVVSTEASIEFMEQVPGEVRRVLTKLRKRYPTQEEAWQSHRLKENSVRKNLKDQNE